MATAAGLVDIETPAVPPRQLATLIELYDASIDELQRLDDPEVADLIARLERRRKQAKDLLATQTAAASLRSAGAALTFLSGQRASLAVGERTPSP